MTKNSKQKGDSCNYRLNAKHNVLYKIHKKYITDKIKCQQNRRKIMKEMSTKEQAEAFCDKYIELVDTIIQFNNSYRGEIIPCIPKSRDCHMFCGLIKLAELLEIEVFKKPFLENSKLLRFTYKGVDFYEMIRSEKL